MKRCLTLILIFILLAVFFTGCSEDRSPVEQTDVRLAPPIKDESLFDKGTILVKFRSSALPRDINALTSALGATVKDVIPVLNVTVLKVPAGQAEALAQRFSRSPIVEYAELNGIARAFYEPNDPYLSEQWGLSKIGASGAWDITKGAPGIKIAILDTGIDDEHEDVSSKVVLSRNFTDSPTNDDIDGHGTHCAGIAAAITDNEIGVAGLGFNCSLMDYKVLCDEGWGYYDWIAKDIIYAAIDGAKVISMSLGGYWPSLTLRNAVAYAWSRGAVITAAAGNDGVTYASYPAYYDRCIAVAATDQDDNKAWFSNYGNWVDVAAPGVDILSTYPDNLYYYGDGTSMSTPFVAGLAGLLWNTSYGTSNSSVRNRIESTCVKVGSWVVHGRINASAALGASALAPAVAFRISP